MRPHITIIVATHNRSGMLARLLASLAALEYPSWDVIVVDDGSTDDTAAVAELFRRDGLPLTYLRQRWQKMGAARNLGLAHARGEIAAFTDDDCLVEPGWLRAIADAFTAHTDAMGVQGKTVTDHAAMTPFTRQVEQLEGGQPYRTCNIAYRTALLRDLGGFDPHLIRGEDVLMGARVLERGPIVFAPDAVVCHPPRPKEWAGRHAWRTLLESETHFKRAYPRYAPARSQQLSVQSAEHVISRWLLLPIRRYWRWHYAYLRREPLAYARHIPLMAREKLALFSLLPYFLHRWRSGSPVAEAESDETPAPIPRAQYAQEPSPLISVVVPTRNRAALLSGLLAALEAQEYSNIEVVMADDASTDVTPELLERWAGEVDTDQRRVVRLERPGGSYAARNAGWHASRGEIVAFTDDDCLPQPGWLSALGLALSDPAVPAAQGVTLAVPGEITPFTHQIEQTEPGPPYRTCNMAYRRETLTRLGGFDDRFRWYADNILGLEAGRLGPIAFAADAVVFHPPRPREWRDRDDWLARFRADAAHRGRLQALGVERKVVSSGFLPPILWVARPLLKQGGAHGRYLLRHPFAYLRQAPAMAREKLEMPRAMRAYWSGESEWQGANPTHPDTSLPPLPQEPRVTVVIVTRSREDMLSDALAAIEGQTWRRRETVVVEHGGDGARELAARHGARYLAVPASATLAEARQAGLSAATGEIVAFTDDDCLPKPRWLHSAVLHLSADTRTWGVQGQTSPQRGPIGAHSIRVGGHDRLYQTCNIAYRRDALMRVGGFDPNFLGWFEDTALGARVEEGGGSIAYAPEMRVVHRAVSRVPLNRERWRSVLHDERRLARRYATAYRGVRGPSFLASVLARWLIGSPLKTLLRELPAARRDPHGYTRLALSLLEERRQLVLALGDIIRWGDDSD